MPHYAYAFDRTLTAADGATLHECVSALANLVLDFVKANFSGEFVLTCDTSTAAVFGSGGRMSWSGEAILSLVVSAECDAKAFRNSHEFGIWEESKA